MPGRSQFCALHPPRLRKDLVLGRPIVGHKFVQHLWLATRDHSPGPAQHAPLDCGIRALLPSATQAARHLSPAASPHARVVQTQPLTIWPLLCAWQVLLHPRKHHMQRAHPPPQQPGLVLAQLGYGALRGWAISATRAGGGTEVPHTARWTDFRSPAMGPTRR